MERPAPVLMSGTKLPFGSTELHFLCENLGLCVTSLDLTCWDSHRTRPSGQHRAEGGELATGTEARSWAARVQIPPVGPRQPVWPWASSLTSLHLCFCICKMVVRATHTSGIRRLNELTSNNQH